MMRPNRRRDPFLMFLFMNLAYQVSQLPIKPFVTLVLIGASVVVHFGHEFDLPIPSLNFVCIPPASLLQSPNLENFGRMIAASFFHFDDWHLYYNCASLVWKGANIENHIGSEEFLKWVAMLLLLNNFVFLALAHAAWAFGITNDPFSCAMGLSGLVFALKVILNHQSTGTSLLIALPVPTRYLAWAEIFLYSALYPHVSLLGHISGVLSGYVFIKVLDLMRNAIPATPTATPTQTRAPQTYGSGVVGSRGPSQAPPPTSAPQRPTTASATTPTEPSPPSAPSQGHVLGTNQPSPSGTSANASSESTLRRRHISETPTATEPSPAPPQNVNISQTRTETLSSPTDEIDRNVVFATPTPPSVTPVVSPQSSITEDSMDSRSSWAEDTTTPPATNSDLSASVVFVNPESESWEFVQEESLPAQEAAPAQEQAVDLDLIRRQRLQRLDPR
eukprot:c7262_g1_i1.p1 GENE.c7262_g1_i1~~c7262_g1_i1.p1  ORF type:complete len:447 (+),score=88.86 c7262_g1_i1:96-1436(+)